MGPNPCDFVSRFVSGLAPGDQRPTAFKDRQRFGIGRHLQAAGSAVSTDNPSHEDESLFGHGLFDDLQDRAFLQLG